MTKNRYCTNLNQKYGANIEDIEQFIEFTDFEDETIVLTNSAYNHIIDRHGSIVAKYVKFIAETLQHPYAFGNSKKYPGVKIYASKNTKEKNYPTNYLIIVVNEVNNITTMYFSKNINMIRKQ